MKTILCRRMLVIVSVLFLILTVSSPSHATNFYVGYSIISGKNERYGIIVRFKSSNFTLTEADALYKAISEIAKSLLFGSGYTISSTLPSSALAQGYTGENTWEQFVQKGVAVFTPPVNQVLYLSLYGCDYQGASHMCIRAYVHTGALNLSMFGIPYNTVAGVGALVVVTPIFDSLKALLMTGGGSGIKF